jgi:predicted HTH transcriptional regulator
MAHGFWQQSESRRLEFKETWPGGDQIARSALAFSNGAGGKLVFGVRNEPRELIGVPDNELFALEERIVNHIHDTCAPLIIPEVYIQNVEGKPLLVVEIFPGSQRPYYLKKKGPAGGTYIRIGSVNRKASEQTIASLQRYRYGRYFDEEVHYSISWSELDLSEFISLYRKSTGKELDDAAFRNLSLKVHERGDAFPTNAALLLSSGPEKKRLFPYAKIECARFKGTEPRVFLDQAGFDGPVFSLIEPVIAFIKRNIALSSTIGEVYRQDRWEYPLEAIREALTNAVIHRDYAIGGSDIKVAIFDDMLEITSPGPLPDTLSPEELGSGRSEIRNRVLAPIFKELGLIEGWGTGIRKIRNELKTWPGVELNLQEAGQAFQVQFVLRQLRHAKEVREVHSMDAATEVTTEVTTDVAMEVRLLAVLDGEMSRDSIKQALGLKNDEHFRKAYLVPALHQNLIEMTIPDKPRSSKQRYRITPEGKRYLQNRRTP